ncbi:MAG: dipeptidase [Parvularculaceae bacterium]|nr:dipeptidase [Parvularculaceae bacterium]
MNLKLIAFLFIAAFPALAAPLEDPALEAKARAIHERVMTLDTHVDIPLDYATHKADPGGFTALQNDLPKMRAGGLDAAFFIVYTPQGPLTDEGYAAARNIALTRLAAIHRLVSAYPAEIGLARTAREARAVAKSGRKVAFIGMENAFPLGPNPQQADIDRISADGVRYVGVTHFGHNQFGDSSNPNTEAGEAEAPNKGLTPLGRDLVAALNRSGIMVDVSHASRDVMMQAASLSTAPIIASHSGAKAIADSPRNLDDEQLRALKANGGVVQIVALDVYVKPLNAEQKALQDTIRKEMKLETSAARAAMSQEVEADYNARMAGRWTLSPRASVSDFVDHIDHVVKTIGVDHVGVASDFDGGGGVVGWEDAGETLNVTRELVRRGYSEADIAKIWGGNLLRVLAAVEKEAARLAKG